MIIDCIGCLHGHLPKLEGGDILIVTGDLTARDMSYQYFQFIDWMGKQDYKKKSVIGGNHDGLIAGGRWKFAPPEEFDYLCDSGTIYEGLKIFGSPWTPTFCDWYFMKDRGLEIKKKWDSIPYGTDILVTHGPPFGILDKTKDGNFAGCEELRKAIDRIQPRLHVFSHIHEGYGQMTLKCTPKDVVCVNASIMDVNYNPTNKPIRVEL